MKIQIAGVQLLTGGGAGLHRSSTASGRRETSRIGRHQQGYQLQVTVLLLLQKKREINVLIIYMLNQFVIYSIIVCTKKKCWCDVEDKRYHFSLIIHFKGDGFYTNIILFIQLSLILFLGTFTRRYGLTLNQMLHIHT